MLKNFRDDEDIEDEEDEENDEVFACRGFVFSLMIAVALVLALLFFLLVWLF